MKAMSTTETPPSGRTRKVFSNAEDENIRRLVAKYGVGNWKKVAEECPDRSARQCRERWVCFLAPNVKNGPWTKEEDAELVREVEKRGRRWRQLEQVFPFRSDINIKNRWVRLERIRRRSLVCEPDTRMSAFDRVFSRLLEEDSAKLSTERGVFPFDMI
jgi:hypothetical protein